MHAYTYVRMFCEYGHEYVEYVWNVRTYIRMYMRCVS